MVVEDHGFQRRMALRFLEELGVERVWEAEGGESALRMLRALKRDGNGEGAEVVLVDLDMPGMDGVELIERLANERLAPAVVLVSALDPALLATVQAMTQAYGVRVIGCVEKPLTVAKLGEALQRSRDRLEETQADEFVVGADELRDAIGNREVVPWYQLQVDMANGRPVGLEALARWLLPDGRVVAPRDFIPVVEREGLAAGLTDSILEQGCQCMAALRGRHRPLRLSVNVPPCTLADPASADRYHAIVARHGIHPRDVMLEITERSVMVDGADILGVLARLRLKGFGLSVDDFGTGYSSLLQLAQVPFTELKIDQAFVSGAEQLPRKRAMIEASLQLARKLGLSVVAEGVETVDEWRMLSELGCGVAQGFLVSPPVPADAVDDAIAHWRRPEC